MADKDQSFMSVRWAILPDTAAPPQRVADLTLPDLTHLTPAVVLVTSVDRLWQVLWARSVRLSLVTVTVIRHYSGVTFQRNVYDRMHLYPTQHTKIFT